MKQATVKEEFGNFDFGLAAQSEERAARLHSGSIIVDMMFSGPCGYRSFPCELDDRIRAAWEAHHDPYETVFLSLKTPGRLAIQGKFTDYEECWNASGVTAGSRNLEVGSYERLVEFASHYIAEFDGLPWLVKAVRANDIQQAKAEGKHAAFFYCQPLTPINRNLRLLDMAYDFGLRMLMLTYNSLDFVGAGCTERTDPGLSHFGIQVIQHANELGVIVDTSHCGPRTTLDACEFSSKPVLACHTSAAGVFKHVRAKSDEEIRAVAATGGVIGVYALPCFLSPQRGATIEVMLDHIQYIADLVGPQHVGLGTDWPMQLPKWLAEAALMPLLLQLGFRKEHVSLENLIGFDDYRDFPNITRGLVKRGFSDEQIKGILGGNFLRVFQEVCG